MSDRLADTSQAANVIQLEVLRRLGGEQRSRLALEWSDSIRATAIQGIRDRHSEYDSRRLVLEYARMTLGEHLFQEAFAAETTNLA